MFSARPYAVVALVMLAAAVQCTKSDGWPGAAPVMTTTVTAAEVSGPSTLASPRSMPAPAPPSTPPSPPPTSRPPPKTGAVETIDVPDDATVLVVDAEEPTRAIVYLHGMCSDPRPDLEVWSSSVHEHGVIIALKGDARCPDRGGWTWTSDVSAIEARIEAALAAVRAARHVELSPEKVVLVGMSMGAARAEALAARAPAKYPRLVLLGAPSVPSAAKLKDTKAVALLAGENEPQDNMRQGEAALTEAGLNVRFWELPEATHGTYGPEGSRLMREAVAFVSGTPRPPR